MAENGCEKEVGEVVDGKLWRKREAIELDRCHALLLVVEVAVGRHFDGAGCDIMVKELLCNGDLMMTVSNTCSSVFRGPLEGVVSFFNATSAGKQRNND